jgi:Cu2+-exporting ATPase
MPCTLCDLPTPDPPVTDDDVEGTFCCRGCLEVARSLDDVEAADAGTAEEQLRSEAPASGDADGEVSYLRVEGMHCATCEAFLESEATGHEGVDAAAASYPAGLLKVVHDPDAVDADELPDLVDGLGYRARAAEEEADTHEELGRLLVGGFFGMMAMALYALFLYPNYLGVGGAVPFADLSGTSGLFVILNVALFATVVLGYTGFPILRGAYVSLRAGHPNMDLLVALAATTAYSYSLLALALGRVEVYFDVSVVVVMAVTLGNYYEDRLRERAAGRFADVVQQRASEARLRTHEGTETVDVDALETGDEVVVRDGERVPLDGEVLEGTGAVDESLVTGESLPVRVEAGDPVVGGAVVEAGPLVVAVDADGQSTLDRVLSLLWDVRSSRAGVQRLADRMAAVFVPVVLLVAAVATAWQLAGGVPVAEALLTGLTVLVVSCPCALGLATPLAVAAGVRGALEEGVVVTEGETFERTADADVVVLDKTGTLTTGEMRVVDTAGDERAPALAAAVETLADHPVADAVVDHATLAEGEVRAFERHPGRGVSGVVAGPDDAPGEVLVGRPALFDERGWPVPGDLQDRADAAREAARIPVVVGWGGRARGIVVVGDEPREEWRAVVADLAERAGRVVVLSGDAPEAAERFGAHLGVDEVFAGVPPDGKTAVVERLRAEGTVVMVGDGSNDAPALAAADLGIALGGGTAMAADAADAVVVEDDLRGVAATFAVTAGARRRIRENLGWALTYNAIAVPLAATGHLNPLLAAVAMATSSLLVVANSSRALGDDADAADGSGASGEDAAATGERGRGVGTGAGD